MRLSRRIAAPIMILVLCAALPAFAQRSKRKAKHTADSEAMVIATVNGEKITRREVIEDMIADQVARLAVTKPQFIDRQRPVAASIGVLVMKRMQKNGGRPVTVSRAEVIEWLFEDKPQILMTTVDRVIQERVVAQAARAKGVGYTPQELKDKTTEAMNLAREQLRLGKVSDKELLETVGFRPESLRRNVIASLLVEKMVMKDLETKMGHKLGPDDFLDASRILVKVQTPSADAGAKEKAFQEALTKITGYREEIRTGKTTFETAAQQHSDDGSKFQGGSLGLFIRGHMLPEFEKAAFTMDVGKVSDPVRSANGWDLIRVNRQGKDTTGPERANVIKNYVRTHIQPMMMELMKPAKINNTLAPKPGAAPQMERD